MVFLLKSSIAMVTDDWVARKQEWSSPTWNFLRDVWRIFIHVKYLIFCSNYCPVEILHNMINRKITWCILQMVIVLNSKWHRTCFTYSIEIMLHRVIHRILSGYQRCTFWTTRQSLVDYKTDQQYFPWMYTKLEHVLSRSITLGHQVYFHHFQPPVTSLKIPSGLLSVVNQYYCIS